MMDRPETASPRRVEIASALKGIFSRVLRIDLQRLDADAPFLELGADSLALVEALRGIQESFGIRMTIRQLFEQVPTISALSELLDNTLPADSSVSRPEVAPAPVPEPQPVAAVPVPPPAPAPVVETAPAPMPPMVSWAPAPAAPPVGGSALERLLLMQLDAFNQMVEQQLRLLAGRSMPVAPVVDLQPPAPQIPTSRDEAPQRPPVAATPPPPAPVPSPPPVVEPVPVFTGILDLPLTEAQGDLFTVAQLGDEASMAYNEGGAAALRGPLDLDLLRRAVQTVVDRHEALRTVILSAETQRVLPRVAVEVPVTDASAYPPEEHASLAAAWLAEESRQVFDLARGPLFRVSLLRLDPATHLLSLYVHHIVLDGLSVALVFTELMEVYGALRAGRRLTLPPPLPFREYVRWLEGQIAEVETAASAHWREVFQDGVPVFEPPTDRPRPAVRSFRGDRRSEPVTVAERGAVQKLARGHGATLFVAMLAAWSALLHRWTGQDDLVIGVPTSRRPIEGNERVVGFCSDLTPIRSRTGGPSGGLTFAEHLKAIRSRVFESQDQGAYPFSRIVRSLNLPRDPGRSPLVNNVFNMDQPLAFHEAGGLGVEMVPPAMTHVKLDLLLQPLETADGLSLDLDYATSLFDASTAQRLVSRLRTLLAAAAADPGQPLIDLPLLPLAERQQLLDEWSGVAGIHPTESLPHELFEAWAARDPEAVALEGAEGSVTYGELNRRANQLAWHLRSLGVGPEVRVGVCLERSFDLVTALLAVAKAGGAYVPLAPDYPQERLEWMLGDAGAPVLLTKRHLADELPVFLVLVVALDEDADFIARQPDSNPPREVSPDGLAYMMYTSGSTGQPKAVAIPHRGITRLVEEPTCARLDLEEILAFFAPASFDASTLEIWGALANGCRLVVPPAGPFSLAELGEAVERHGVTTLWLTSALLQQVALEELPRLRSVRQLLTGGDVTPPETFRQCLRELPGLRLIHCYGPTENTTFTTVWFLDRPADIPDEGWSVPIGHPIGGTDVYVVDPEMRLVPAGSFGELVTGGEGLARGYHERPDLTAERFVPHPFSTLPGARVYRTGDRVRFRFDGSVEFLSRLDRQVKVRGFRIEPGEVEVALARHPAVREAVVVVRRGGTGDDRLLAFVTSPQPEAADLPAELRSFLAESLPPYMVPSEIAVLPEMPLTPSGKADRRALAALEIQGDAAEHEMEAPRNAVEEILAGAWAEILKRDPISIRDSFFDLGGHSLLATQVLSRIRNAFGVEVSLSAFFAEPTVAGLGALVERARRQGESAAAEPIRRVRRDRSLPLSFAQRRLWFFDRFEIGSALYNVPLRVRLRGALQLRPLAGALAHVFLRHEALRTVFTEVDGQPVQTIRPGVPHLPVVDLSALPEPVRTAESERVAREDALRPFDLSAGPLLRTALIRLEEDHHRLFLHLHHITSDAWSIAILGNEIAAFYRTLAAGGRVTEDWPLPSLPLQYADFAAWQQEWFQGEVLERQLGYWRERLACAPATLDLPTDHPRPAVQTFRGAIEPTAIPASLVQPLERFGRRRGATLFMTLLAAYATVFQRYSGQDDILLGTPVANRNRADIEGLIGFFVNTLVMRVDLTGDPTFGELVDRVRETALGAYAHQDLPFERLVELLAPERDLARGALFQVAFALQNAPMPDLSMGPGLSAALEDTRTDTSKFDFAISLQEPYSGPTGGLVGEVEYSTDLFEAETVRRFLDHYRTLLAGAAEKPEARISELPLLGEAERRQILVEWNQTRTSTPRGAVLHRLFEESARRTPEAVAVDATLTGGGILTYGELNRRANRLAWQLRDLGVGPETRVALYLERSAEMIVALLAVLKAGGAYVPLDPSDPEERLRFFLEDTGAPVRIGRGPAPVWLAAGGSYLDVEEALAARTGREDDLPGPSDGESLVYVLYTSGSTGRPKGVAVPHRAVPRLALDNLYLPLSPADRVAHLSNTAFDASVLEVWVAFLNGAALVVVPREVVLSPAALSAEVDRHGITVMFLTTALFHQLAAELEQGRGPRKGTLRSLMFGGEAGDPRWARVAREALPAHVRLMNAYGPTEGTTFTTWYPVEPGRELPKGIPAVPIGGPIAQTRVHVLDPGLRPIPSGVPGELYLGGDGLARGYWSRPDLTAERFVPDPFAGEEDLASEPGARLYRTGDRVRYRADGNLEFLGRLDQQVKLRGFRIEPGEIEAALVSHPSVEAAAVLVCEEGPGSRSLAAYVVRSAGSEALGEPELRRHLEARLPAYMVPARFAFLEALPLTPSGKIDRRALASLRFEAAQDLEAPADEAPRSPVETVVATFWAELLDVEHSGLHDNFFDQGGHSLLATVLLSRLRAAFGVEISLVAFFQDPTIAGLAQRLAEARVEGAPPLVARGWESEAPLSYGQERLWFLDRLAPGLAAYNMPTLMRTTGPLREAALGAALAGVARRHEVLRTVFVVPPGSERPVQRVLPPEASPVLPVVDLSGLPEPLLAAEATRVEEEETRRPFDLERGPLLRALLLRRGIHGNGHGLVLTPHHIVADGWSLDVLASELSALYRAAVSGQPSPLPELPLQYGDFAIWQRRWLSGGVLEEQLAYWRQRLAGAPAVLDLPGDLPRPAVQSFRGRRVQSAWSLPVEPVHRLARRHGATAFMVLLAGFQALLSRLAGLDDLLVGSPVANRNRAETERLIGFFVNLLVLRTDLSGDPSFDGLIERARETALGAYSHQDLPFEALVEALAPDRDLSRTPLVQVAFTVEAPAVSRLSLAPGLEAAFEKIHTGTAKFDLLVSLEERDGVWLAELEHSSDLFEEATGARYLRLFETLLAGALADPATRLSDLPLLTEEDRRQLLAWSRTAPAESGEATVHGLVEEQAVRRPDAAALVSGDDGSDVWTYAELDRRAERLAHRLRTLGAGPEVPVGIFLERSADLIATLLAVLKAGGFYLPLDPAYPEERLAFLLEDSGARIVVTREALAGRLPKVDGISLLLLNKDGEEPASGPAVPVTADNTAYLMYTSGSTGRPKGVLVRHRGIARLVRQPAGSGFEPEDVWAQLSTLSFDASTLEIWGALVNGGRLVVPPAGQLSPEEVADLVRRHGVTSLFLTTPLFPQMVEVGLPGLGSVRNLLVGGDVLPPPAARRFLEARPDVQLTNYYGPTENTTATTSYRVPLPSLAVPIPIGRPLPGDDVYVVDPGFRPVPVGIPGELVAGGPGLARGYHGRPDLTAERFVPHPFGDQPGERLYRTGDLARFLADGNLAFLGRVDHQVKVRGFRVEPQEIEAALLLHPEVVEAAVVARRLPQGDESLVGFVTGGPGLDCAVLRGWVAQTLPAHMVPTIFAAIPELPRTPTGKVDRRALVGLPLVPRQATPGSTLPRTPLEELVAAVWADVLGIAQAGIYDNFFETGGHSLLATVLLSRLRVTLGSELALADFFREPTVAGLAARIEQARHEQSGLAVPPLQRVPRDLPLRLSFAQERLWLIDQLQPGRSNYNSYMPLVVEGQLDLPLLVRVLTEIARRHEVLRTRFAQGRGGPVQIIEDPAPWPVPVIDLRGLPDDVRTPELVRLAGEEGHRPFDLARGPLRRATVVRLGPTYHGLLFNLHHSVCDGWSLEVLTRELEAIYPAFASGRPSPLPELPVQYADFATWQRDWLQGEVYERQLDYWKRQLGERPPVLDLPTDRPRPRVQTFRGGMHPLTLSPALTQELHALGRRCGGTLFNLMLAAFQILLHHLAGQDRVSVGTPVAGRTRPEIEGLIGFFINTLVLSTDLSGDPTVAELLGRVREVTLGAFDHQDFPFDKVVAALETDRDPGRQPLFQAMLAFQNTKPLQLHLPGLELGYIATGPNQVLFDLVLTLGEEPEGGVAGNLAYNADLYEAATVARWVGSFERLLTGMVEDPECRLSGLPLMSDEERRQVLFDLPASAAKDGSRPYILDGQGRPVPPGAWGELCWLPEGQEPEGLGSDAFSGRVGDLFRRTGERARFRSDGSLQRAGEAAEATAATQKAARQAEHDERRRQVTSRRGQLSPERLAVLRKWVKGPKEETPDGSEP